MVSPGKDEKNVSGVVITPAQTFLRSVLLQSFVGRVLTLPIGRREQRNPTNFSKRWSGLLFTNAGSPGGRQSFHTTRRLGTSGAHGSGSILRDVPSRRAFQFRLLEGLARSGNLEYPKQARSRLPRVTPINGLGFWNPLVRRVAVPPIDICLSPLISVAVWLQSRGV